MPKITPLKVMDIIKKMKKLGYEGPYPGGRHMHMIKGETIIPLPMHGGKDIGVGLISTIIDELKISRDERLKL